MRRLYVQHAAYFVTSITNHRIPFFKEDLFCHVLYGVIFEVVSKKEGHVIGFKINPDHVHLLIQVRGSFNISKIIQAVKRISSVRINQIICHDDEDNSYENLKWSPELAGLHRQFVNKHGSGKLHEYPLFRWLKGFDDRIVRCQEGLYRTIQYLRTQHVKHNMEGQYFLYINKEIPKDIKYFQT